MTNPEPSERASNSRGAGPGPEPGGQDLRIVGDQEVPGGKQVRKVPHAAVIEGARLPAQDHQPRAVTGRGRMPRDPAGREIVVEHQALRMR